LEFVVVQDTNRHIQRNGYTSHLFETLIGL
jgi:hypothetical protein